MSQTKLNIRKGDTVVVISGKDAGKKGKVLAVSPKKSRIIVEGVNIVARHKKPRSAQDKGGIIKKEGTIHVSNAMVVCGTCGKATRVKHETSNGKNVRVCKCGGVLDKKYSKAKKSDKAEAKPVEKESATKAEGVVKAEKVAPKIAPKVATKKIVKKEVATATNEKAERLHVKVKRGDA